MTRLIDLRHANHERVIACYLVDTDEGPALFDCGPSSTIPALEVGLAENGLELHDIRHLLLSHIHLDHAGAAGTLARRHPGLHVWVSEAGAPHLADPAKLERSARRLFGEAFDALWGELVPVPPERLHAVGDRVLGLECFATPGHASHHVTYTDDDGVSYNGDAAGIRIAPHDAVVAPTLPPEVDLDAWRRSLDEIERRSPQRLALVHFGIFDDPPAHLAGLREALERASELVRGGAGADDFVAALRAGLPPDGRDEYERAGPLAYQWQGLRRYWDKRLEAANTGSYG